MPSTLLAPPSRAHHGCPPRTEAVAADPDVLALLRRATATAHHRLETMLALTDSGSTVSRYRAVLARLLGFWLAWEPTVGSALGDPGFLAPRRRTGALRCDLRALGLDEAALAALPRCVPLALDGPAAALGSLYVLEGSTLGGRVLVRQFALSLGLRDGEPGCLYFSGYGAATGRMWAEFCARLRAAPADGAPETVRARRRHLRPACRMARPRGEGRRRAHPRMSRAP